MFTDKQKTAIKKAAEYIEAEELRNGVLEILDTDIESTRANQITDCVFRIAYPHFKVTGYNPEEKYRIMNDASAELYDALNALTLK